MLNKENYIIAKANGVVDRLRGDEISRRIAKVYPLSAQIALLMDRDFKYDEWQQYQAFRKEIKNAVDQEIAAIEAEINHGA
jgi:hypothetical protein